MAPFKHTSAPGECVQSQKASFPLVLNVPCTSLQVCSCTPILTLGLFRERSYICRPVGLTLPFPMGA